MHFACSMVRAEAKTFFFVLTLVRLLLLVCFSSSSIFYQKKSDIQLPDFFSAFIFINFFCFIRNVFNALF